MSKFPFFFVKFLLVACSSMVFIGKVSSQSLYNRAPAVVPGTLPEMRTTEYWIDRMDNPDEVLLTLTEIRSMNEEYEQKMSDFSGLDSNLVQTFQRQLMFSPGLAAVPPEVESFTAAELSEKIRNIINSQAQMLERRSFGNRLAVKYSEAQIDEMINELNADEIEDEIEAISALVVENSLLRVIPAIRPEYTGLSQAGKTRWDLWNMDVVSIGTPIHVLHTTKTGGYVLAATPRGFGWIESESVAFAEPSFIEDYSDSRNFLVVTGDRVPFYSGSEATYVSGWLRMGDRIPINDSDPTKIIVPIRNSNGELSTGTAWLAPDADVHVGFLPYTRKNVVLQTFKLLDNVYDWTNGWFGRNHATTLRDVFSTFGFQMPSNGVFLAYYNSNIKVIPEGQNPESKYDTMTVSEPFITFQTSRSGHNQLYLGEYDGEVIVFDTHGYAYEKDGETLELRRAVVGTVELPDYMLQQDMILTEIK